MSRPMQENVACPACKTESPFTMWTSLNVTLDPAQKQPLLAGELFRFTCPSCGERTQVIYPLLYHDMERRLMIWFVPPDENGRTIAPEEAGMKAAGQMQGYTFRTVLSPNELFEKILVFDAQLDDLTVEMVKLAIATQIPENEQSDETEIYFASLEEGDAADGPQMMFAVVTPNGTKGATLPREPIYSNMQKAVAELASRKPPQAGEWPTINGRYLMNLMELGGASGEGGRWRRRRRQRWNANAAAVPKSACRVVAAAAAAAGEATVVAAVVIGGARI
jgi:hypothetical protein